MTKGDLVVVLPATICKQGSSSASRDEEYIITHLTRGGAIWVSSQIVEGKKEAQRMARALRRRL